MLDRCDMPSAMTAELKKIAKIQGIRVDASTTPNKIINQLQTMKAKGGATSTKHHFNRRELSEIAETVAEQLNADRLTGLELVGAGKRGTKIPVSFTTEEIKKLLDSINPSIPPSASDDIYDLAEAPLFNNVFENRGDYVLTNAMEELADARTSIIEEVLRLMKAEGVDVRELQAFDEAFTYGPRFVFDPNTGERAIKTSPTGSFKETRFHKYMESELLANGGQYGGPTRSLDVYIRGGFQEIAHTRKMKTLEKLSKKKRAPEDIIENARLKRARVDNMTELINTMPRIRHGYLPTGPVRRAFKREFHEFGVDFDEILELREADADKIIAGIGADVIREMKIDLTSFKKQLIAVQDEARDIAAMEGERPKGKYGKASYVEGGDSIREAIKLLGLEKEQAAKLVVAANQSANTLLGTVRRKKIEDLTERMKAAKKEAEHERNIANQEEAIAKSKAGTTVTEITLPEIAPGIVFDRETGEMLKKIWEKDKPATSLIRWMSKASGALRKFKTIFDLGAPLIHGLPVLYNDPEAWGKATVLHIRQLTDPTLRSQYIAQNSEAINDFLRHGGTLGSSEYTQKLMDDGLFASLPVQITNSGRIPGPLKPVAAGIPRTIHVTSERFANSFELFLDAARIETWQALRPSVGDNARDLNTLASYVNKITGTSESRVIGVPLSQQELESAAIFFAPRYFRSIAAVMLDTFSGKLRGELAFTGVSRLMMGVVLTYVAMQRAMDQPIHLDPTNPSEFLSTEVFGQKIRPGSKFASNVKMLARIGVAVADNPTGFLNWKMLDAETYRDNPILKSLRYQTSPASGNILNFLTGADPMGRAMPDFTAPMTDWPAILKYGFNQAAPFFGDAMLEGALASEERLATMVRAAIVGGIAEFFGTTAQPLSWYDKHEKLMNEKSLEVYGRTWEWMKDPENQNRGGSTTGGSAEMALLYKTFNDLQDSHTKVLEEAHKNVLNEEKLEFWDQRSNIKQDFRDALAVAEKAFINPEGQKQAGAKWRRAYSDASIAQKSALKYVKLNYPTMVEDQDKVYDELGKQFPLIAATSRFLDMFDTDIPDGGALETLETDGDRVGRVNYEAKARIEAGIDEKFGAGTMARVKQNLAANNINRIDYSTGKTITLGPVTTEYLNSFEVLEDYWGAYKIFVPEEHWRQWGDYEKAFDKQRRNEISEQFIALPFKQWEKQIDNHQEMMAKNDTEVDMALVMFYDRKPQNDETKEHVLKIINQEATKN